MVHLAPSETVLRTSYRRHTYISIMISLVTSVDVCLELPLFFGDQSVYEGVWRILLVSVFELVWRCFPLFEDYNILVPDKELKSNCGRVGRCSSISSASSHKVNSCFRISHVVVWERGTGRPYSFPPEGLRMMRSMPGSRCWNTQWGPFCPLSSARQFISSENILSTQLHRFTGASFSCAPLRFSSNSTIDLQSCYHLAGQPPKVFPGSHVFCSSITLARTQCQSSAADSKPKVLLGRPLWSPGTSQAARCDKRDMTWYWLEQNSEGRSCKVRQTTVG